jgi:hypothetical protein
MSLEQKYSSIRYKSQVQLKITTGAAILRTSHTTALLIPLSRQVSFNHFYLPSVNAVYIILLMLDILSSPGVLQCSRVFFLIKNIINEI